MSQKSEQFITGLNSLIEGSQAIRGKADLFELIDRRPKNLGRVLSIRKDRGGISAKDVMDSGLTPIAAHLLASALGETGAVYVQAYQSADPGSKDPAFGYLQVAAAANHLGLKAMYGYNPMDMSKVEITLAGSFEGESDTEEIIATAASQLFQEWPDPDRNENDATAIMLLAENFIKNLAVG